MKMIRKIVGVTAMMAAGIGCAHAGDITLGQGMGPDQYTDFLRSDVGQRLHYQSPEAREFVSRTRVSCGTHSYMPLETFLLAGIETYEQDARKWKSDMHEDRFIDFENGGVKIYSKPRWGTADYMSRTLYMIVNRAGDVGADRVQAVLDKACSGSIGPLVRSGDRPTEAAVPRIQTQKHFALQLGIFPDSGTAITQAQAVRAAGLPAYVERQSADQFSLRAGPFDSQETALQAVDRVKDVLRGDDRPGNAQTVAGHLEWWSYDPDHKVCRRMTDVSRNYANIAYIDSPEKFAQREQTVTGGDVETRYFNAGSVAAVKGPFGNFIFGQGKENCEAAASVVYAD